MLRTCKEPQLWWAWPTGKNGHHWLGRMQGLPKQRAHLLLLPGSSVTSDSSFTRRPSADCSMAPGGISSPGSGVSGVGWGRAWKLGGSVLSESTS